MNKLKKYMKQSIMLLLILSILSSVLVPTVAFGASARLSIRTSTNYKYMNNWGYPNSRNGIHLATVSEGANKGKPAYCIEFGKVMGDDGQFENETSIFDVPAWRSFKEEQRSGIKRATIYGYPNYTYGVSAEAAQVATQFIIWEYSQGYRTSADGNNPTAGLVGDSDKIRDDTASAGFDVRLQYYSSGVEPYSDVETAYRGILNRIKNHMVKPSLDGNTYVMKWNASKLRYEVRISDSKSIIGDFDIPSSVGSIKFEKSGNALTVYSKDAVPSDRTVSLLKSHTNAGADLGYIPNENKKQCLTGMLTDPVYSTFRVRTESGNVHLKKTSESGKVEGIAFTIQGNGLTYNCKTDRNGEFTLMNIPTGTYTVTEHARDEDVQPESQTIIIRANQTTEVKFHNILKKFRVEVVKKDNEEDEAQGDATLEGAVYGLYNNGELVQEYTTDAQGKFTTDYEICGNKWTLKEKKASEGYNLDKTVYPIPAGAKNFKIELNTIKKDVYEPVIKGKINIIKHSNTCDEQIETPEKGAEFQVYLKSAGSYEKAKPYEKDIVVTDENGFAQTKDLPYGAYVVHQTKGLEGTKYVPDFYPLIEKHGKEYNYLLNNPPFKSYIKIEKVDIETKKPITSSSAGYQIYDPSGNLVTMRYTYPTPTTIDTFYTNSEGYLVTPEKLPLGRGYKLVEVQAPYGYVLDSTPVEFDVTQDDSSNEGGLTIVPVTQGNPAQKGVIEISKTGEIFTSVDKNQDLYTPKFEEKSLPDAEFEIYAAEDIVTGDGTVRAEKGTLVDTIVTDSEGKAKSQQLYLGQYIVKESKAPNTFVLDETEYEAVLSYAGQEVETVAAALSIYNPRQTVSVSLAKVLEQDELYSIGMNHEIRSVNFGVFSTDCITALDESQIPADALIASSYCDSDGSITFSCDLPIGFNWYVKELKTDEHYIISDAKYDFSSEYQGQEVKTIDVKINNGNAISNPLKYGEIHGKKLDDSSNALADAVIGIFKADTEKFTAETAVTTTTSAEDGTFSFLKVPMGKYIVKEIAAPDDYLIDSNDYVVELTDDNQFVTLEIVNVLKRGEIRGTKVNEKGDALKGALIGLFDADIAEFTAKTALMTSVSDENGSFAFKDIRVGKYIVKELKAPKGYILNDNEFEINLTENNQIAEIEIVNQPKPVKKLSPLTGAEDIQPFMPLLCAAGAMLLLSGCAAKRKKEQG